MRGCMHGWVYENLAACKCVCIHVCVRMRVCTFCNTPPPPPSIEVCLLALPPSPSHIEKLPTHMLRMKNKNVCKF